MTRLIVDAMNVIGSRPNGWWRDRDGAIRRFVDELQRYASADGRAITVVIDGRPLPRLPEGAVDGIEVLYARRSGANAADDRIIEYLRAAADASAYQVVTSDRTLADRARRCGASVCGASWLLEQLDAPDRDHH